MNHCPALFIAASSSGQGKTTVTAALARHYRERGLRVRVFKTGPDFLDPMLLEVASGAPVYQLDLWMGGEAHCRQLLYAAAADADLILVEGVMGLFDGERSGADLAQLFGLPILAVIDAAAMAQTFGAVALGLATYRPQLAFAGVLANRVAGSSHAERLAGSLLPTLPFFGYLTKKADIALPERHLGLVQASEIGDLEQRIGQAASALSDIPEVLPTPVAFAAPLPTPPSAERLDGVRIAIARDAAFAFLYRANLDLLQSLGAQLYFFSPLEETCLPEADALYLPGGYPELHLDRLAANTGMRAAIRAHHAAGRPLFAECGGMLYLLDSLTDIQGNTASMLGLLPGTALMQPRLAHLGLHQVALPEGLLRGHSFHYSRLETALEATAISESARPGGVGEAVYRVGRLTASYLHLYFPSNPLAVARLFAPDSRKNR